MHICIYYKYVSQIYSKRYYRDFTPSEVGLRNYLKEKIKLNFELFGFEPIETPSFEKLEIIAGKYGNDGEQLVFKILSNGEKLSKADLDSLGKKITLGSPIQFLKKHYDMT